MRIVWLLIVETKHLAESDATRSPTLIRWAVVGLAVVGVAALILWRLATR